MISVPQGAVASSLTDAQFFVDYPDLHDELEVISVASQELVAEGFHATDDLNAREVLAQRTRSLLSQRTSAEWQKKAVSLYPALAVAGSEFNLLFLQHHRELQESTPAFEQEASWPVLLAKRCADELSVRTPATVAPQPARPPPPSAAQRPSRPTPAPIDSLIVSSPQKTTTGMQVILAGAFLLTSVLLPSLLLFRWISSSDRFPPRLTLSPWLRALKPATLAYGIGGVIAVIRSLPANEDLSLTNRVFITFFISVLFGGCVGVVGYLFALLYCALHPRDGRPHLHYH